jgi:hypothetical protein
LSGKRRSAAPAQDGSVVFAAEGDGGDDIVNVARNYYTYGNLAVAGTVGGIKSAAAVIEADFPADMATQ